MDLALGALQLSLIDVDTDELLLVAYLAADAGMDLGLTDAGSLTTTVSDAILELDVTYPADSSMDELEEFLEEALPVMLEDIMGTSLAEIPIPALSGYVITDITMGLEGAEDGYFTLSGVLTPE